MRRLYILCEGQTEENFVNTILNPYLYNMAIFAIPIICATKRTSARKYKGGVSSFGKIEKELRRLCDEHTNEMVTTMFDLYALPHDTPGLGSGIRDVYEKVRFIEGAVSEQIGNKHGNMIFNLVLHEFEGLLFSDVSAFSSAADNEAVDLLKKVRDAVPTPEHINDSPETAPSKRVAKAIPAYSKVVDGIDIAEKIGIEKMKSECRHFSNWLDKLIRNSRPTGI